jgi:hypothetical protein
MIKSQMGGKLCVVFLGGVGSDLALPIIEHLRLFGVEIFATPSKRYPERNARLLDLGVVFEASQERLEEVHRELVSHGSRPVCCLEFSSAPDPDRLARFAALSATLHISTVGVAEAWLEEQKTGAKVDLPVPYLNDKLVATRVQHPHLSHLLVGFVVTTGTSSNACLSSATLARLAQPERTGASKLPSKWWDDTKACTSQDLLTEAVLAWVEQPCTGGVYRLATAVEYSRRFISRIMARRDHTDLLGMENLRLIRYAAVPCFPLVEATESSVSIEAAFLQYADNTSKALQAK